jgi:hypothetical protein
MRRALEIYQKSFEPDRPEVAMALNNLAQLLKDTNRLTEAEPMMRRALLICFKVTRETGYEYPYLRMAFGEYYTLLLKMAMQQDEVFKRIDMLGTEAGFDSESYFRLVQQITQ